MLSLGGKIFFGWGAGEGHRGHEAMATQIGLYVQLFYATVYFNPKPVSPAPRGNIHLHKRSH